MTKIEKIKQLIADKGVTRPKVAERCGVSYSALAKELSGQERAYLSDDKLDRIIAYLEHVNTNDISLD